ncbi:MAG: hypothetical protein KBF98_16150, partial [Rhodoferax sp.]|nr:hypothetical protein [Rhodoferax sp.]
ANKIIGVIRFMGCSKRVEMILVLVLHSAKLADGQTFAGGLQLFVAHIFLFTGLQALGRRFMRGSHGAVPGNVFPGFLVGF